MATPKGIEWNKLQLTIAKYLQAGLMPKQINKEHGLAMSTINKVTHRMKHGENPGTVTDEMIAAAPEPTQFGKYGLAHTPKNTGGNGSTPATHAAASDGPAKAVSIKLLTTAVSQTSFLKLITQTQPIVFTPQMSASYMCAVKNGWAYCLGDWIAYCLEDFWTGRGRNPYVETIGFNPEKKEVAVGQPAG